ncbi:MAG TPA: hypothetical protein DDW29_13815 [Gammaproteobacteria bacterium]|nr:hypothetical protein [Gammaproteobacteria bacterium]
MSSASQGNHLSSIDDNQLDIVDANLLNIDNQSETQEKSSTQRPTRKVIDIQETGDIADQKIATPKDLEAQTEPTGNQAPSSAAETTASKPKKTINPVLKHSSHAALATFKDYGRILANVNDYSPAHDPEKDHIGLPRLVGATVTYPVALVGCGLGILAGGTYELGDRAVDQIKKRI